MVVRTNREMQHALLVLKVKRIQNKTIYIRVHVAMLWTSKVSHLKLYFCSGLIARVHSEKALIREEREYNVKLRVECGRLYMSE